uniref:Kinesin family member C1 n=1 Tax=Sphenodon punctatus TaxID=8508 RepID=A0A8D0HDF7_SPHPU
MKPRENMEGQLVPGKAPSRLPVPGLRPKRLAGTENQPPEEQKRARGPPAAHRAAASVAAVPTRPRALPAAAASPSRRRRGTAAPAPVAGSGPGGKKRAAWDLKGQVSDLRAKAAGYKEKVQGLDGENKVLKRRLHELEHEGQELAAQNKELSSQASTLASELEACREQAEQRLQEVTELSGLKKQLQETLSYQAQSIGQLEGAKRELRALLEAREGVLHQAKEDLAERDRENQALRAQVTVQLQGLTEQEEHLHRLEMERRRLHNVVQELKGNIRVFCRVRPLLAGEPQNGPDPLHFPAQDNKALVLSKAEESHVGRERKGDLHYEFRFDRVFPPSASQDEVFEEIALLVQSALDGYHVCIFAYGQTGSGKTYTMEGPDDLSPETLGMIPHAVQQIFQEARELESKGWQVKEEARGCGSAEGVRGQGWVSTEGHRQRAVVWGAGFPLSVAAVLSLVDLAGSERLDKSLSKGDRLKETQAINSSLSNLGLVIMALSNKEQHVPYRNSKLTYLLQNSLGGNSKMLMFVNISPLEGNFSESLNSLRFASKVNECVIGTAQANRK